MQMTSTKLLLNLNGVYHALTIIQALIYLCMLISTQICSIRPFKSFLHLLSSSSLDWTSWNICNGSLDVVHVGSS
ncbi:hypothetical protein SLEP1_g57929 [Rubroshorea leprosula]|uniref:Uncharacterized protein n=1 Tax=Rubroshorea leprosula TaxID=152421 RepID=A0AAV5MMM3_9ROSI|nr:hypothetical protein SLEP1_g57929 [Rubroshorea leprosula]